jgi:hypothetical protein
VTVPPRRRTGSASPVALVATALSVSAVLVVVVVYLARAFALVGYPWDWSPDEGLHLDYARRLLEAPGTLYPHRAVPFPSAYGPLLPVLMAPLVHLPAPLAAARLMALAWALVGAAAVFELLRRRAGVLWALCGVALYFAPLDMSFWHMLVRVDGPMLALFLWASVLLLPRQLAHGADSLGTRRLLTGTALLLAAVLVKPTAVLHGAPLVLGWFLVDRRSGWRLSLAVGASGLASLGLLQVLTHGGFLWVNRLWALHPKVPGLPLLIVAYFLRLSWPILLLTLLAGLAAWKARSSPQREPALLLVAGGLAILPLLQKHGASWNYFLPLYAALVVTTGCWFAGAAQAPPERSPFSRSAGRSFPLIATSLVALALVSTRSFPLPTALDEATARFFYRFVLAAHARAGGPLLVARPDLLYYLAGQPEEIEGSSFTHLVEGGAPGVEHVLDGLRHTRYSVVVETWPITERPEWRLAIQQGYRHVGGCELTWYFATMMSNILVRRSQPVPFVPPAGVRCFVAFPDVLPSPAPTAAPLARTEQAPRT